MMVCDPDTDAADDEAEAYYLANTESFILRIWRKFLSLFD